MQPSSFHTTAQGQRPASRGSRTLYAPAVVLIIAFGVWLRSDALTGTLLGDDWDHYAMAQGSYPRPRGPLEMYTFVARDRDDRAALMRAGRLPWWTAPDLQLSVLRPLSSLLTRLDYTWLDGQHVPLRLHLHSMAFFVLLLLAVAAVLRALLPEPLALCSLLIYALAEAHGLPVAWAANRNALVAASFTAFGLAAYVRARTRPHGGRTLLATSLACVALGLLGGEHAFSVLAYFAAFELCLASDSPASRLRALAPIAALAAVYLLARSLLGFATAGSGFYVDPSTSPLRYAAAVTARLPILLGDALLGLRAEWLYSDVPFRLALRQLGVLPVAWLSVRGMQQLQHAAGWGALLLVAGALLWLGRARAREHTAVTRFFLTGGLLALLPVCGTIPMARLTQAAAIGIDAVLALVLVAAVRAIVRGRSLWRRLCALLLACAIAVVHLGAAAVHSRLEVAYLALRSRLEEDWVARAPLDDRRVAQQQLFVIAARDLTSQWELPYVRVLHGHPMPGSVDLLSGEFGLPHELMRVGPRVLEITLIGTPHDATFVGSVYRADDEPLPPGRRIACARFTVQVVDTVAGQPHRLRFTFPHALEDPRYAFLYPLPQGLRQIALPAVGQRVRLPAPAFAF